MIGNPTTVGTPVKVPITDFFYLCLAVGTKSLVRRITTIGAVLHPIHFELKLARITGNLEFLSAVTAAEQFLWQIISSPVKLLA